MMAVGAFIQVQQSLRWFIDNFSTIADWRATLQRVAGFRETLLSMDQVGASETHIEFVKTPGNKVTFEKLAIATPTGSTVLSEQYVEIALGDRIVIVGGRGTGKTLLFRAIAGLWPWGSGRVALPSTAAVMFVPRQPYLPLGTLRAVLAYPSPESCFKEEELLAGLQKAGLDHLSSSLSQIERWDRKLADEEQQRVVLTRVLLHKPRLLVIDEALDAMDDDARNRILNLLNEELKDAGIINIGRPEAKLDFFTRVLHLIKDPQGRRFFPRFGSFYLPDA